MKSESLNDLVNQALDAFWSVIAKHYSQATTGDLSPGATITLDLAAQDAVSEWVTNNVPSKINR